jgi:hypothetical protein
MNKNRIKTGKATCNQNWTKGIYYIKGEYYIPAGCSLTIKSGVVVRRIK